MMRKTMKKAVSLILVLAALVAMAIPAMALVPETAEPMACTHTFVTKQITLYGQFQYVDENFCRPRVQTVVQCSKCGYVDSVTESIIPKLGAHSKELFAASCSGTVQTWKYKCQYCNHTFTETHACPKPHASGTPCNWLPI